MNLCRSRRVPNVVWRFLRWRRMNLRPSSRADHNQSVWVFPRGRGRLRSMNLRRSRRVQNNHLVWAGRRRRRRRTIFQGQLRNPPPFPGVDLHCINIFPPLVPFKAFEHCTAGNYRCQSWYGMADPLLLNFACPNARRLLHGGKKKEEEQVEENKKIYNNNYYYYYYYYFYYASSRAINLIILVDIVISHSSR